MKKWYEKTAEGETVYLMHPWEDIVAKVIPDSDHTLVKQKLNGEEYSIENTTNMATDFRWAGTEITEKEYLDYGQTSG